MTHSILAADYADYAANTPGMTGEEAVGRANEALYEAKRTGKNRVVISKSKKGKGLQHIELFVSFRSRFGALGSALPRPRLRRPPS